MGIADLLALLGTGALAGLIAGFLGIGGGAILTPLCLVMFPVFGIPPDNLVQVIFGTNMFLVTVFSVSAVSRHHGNRNIIWRTVLIMGPLAVIGSFAGGWVASVSHAVFLKKAFAALLLFSSTLIILKGSAAPSTPGRSAVFRLSESWLPVLGFFTGFLGSMLGIGGGVVMIMPLILLFKLPIERVAGTSSSVIIFIGLAGMVSYMVFGRHTISLPGWHTGYVWWSAAIPLMIGGVPLAQAGAWLNNRIHAKLLRRIFGAVLFIIAVRLLFS
ncbi:sulfite exporter TauE/SafE family protein [Candidatus Latescibacterota bacterium]